MWLFVLKMSFFYNVRKVYFNNVHKQMLKIRIFYGVYVYIKGTTRVSTEKNENY